MTAARWQDLFEDWDRVASRAATEMRHPYLDLRVLRFMLAAPAIPWCCNKYLLRRAFRGELPEPVVRRPKTPLANYPAYERACQWGVPKLPISKNLLHFVRPDRLPSEPPANIEDFRGLLRVVGLGYWFQSLKSGQTNVETVFESCGRLYIQRRWHK